MVSNSLTLIIAEPNATIQESKSVDSINERLRFRVMVWDAKYLSKQLTEQHEMRNL